MELSHVNKKGEAIMVDVSAKAITAREAVATGRIYLARETIALLVEGKLPKGDVLAVARVAGIMAAKRTQELIPMCHSVPLDSAKVDFTVLEKESAIEITATARCTYKTGVEMEALTAVSIAALTIYDMCKAVDKKMVIGEILLVKKTGGKNHF
jgi:cyclic pyranopterin monophosphate synthase